MTETNTAHPDYKVPVTEDEIIKALSEARGNVTAAARSLDRARKTIEVRIKGSPVLMAHVAQLREEIIDKAEENIYNDVEKGDQAASKFVLQTIGKDRGFVSRVESTGKDGQNHSEGMASEIGRVLDGIASRILGPGDASEVSG
jgi:ribosome maturation protein Sdo1